MRLCTCAPSSARTLLGRPTLLSGFGPVVLAKIAPSECARSHHHESRDDQPATTFLDASPCPAPPGRVCVVLCCVVLYCVVFCVVIDSVEFLFPSCVSLSVVLCCIAVLCCVCCVDCCFSVVLSCVAVLYRAVLFRGGRFAACCWNP